jgi:hypothetical protein
LIRKAMGDALPRTFEVPEGLKLFGDHRDEQLVSVLGMVISITRRQLRRGLPRSSPSATHTSRRSPRSSSRSPSLGAQLMSCAARSRCRPLSSRA